MRVNIILACTECKRRNYSTRKNKKNTTGRLEMKKYCPWTRSTRFTEKPGNNTSAGGSPLPPDGTQGSSSNG